MNVPVDVVGICDDFDEGQEDVFGEDLLHQLPGDLAGGVLLGKEEEDGQVFYRSPGYPAPPRSRSITQISTSVPTLSPDQPIKEKVTPFTGTEEVEEEERFVRRRREEVPTSPSPTRIFTSSGGITRLRTYSPPPVDETSSALTPSSPGLLPRSETLPRCPHCTIHAWLPHSPGCPNKSK